MNLESKRIFLNRIVQDELSRSLQDIGQARKLLDSGSKTYIKDARNNIARSVQRLESYHPNQVLKRGYGIVRINQKLYKPGAVIHVKDKISVEVETLQIEANVEKIMYKKED